MHKNPAPSPPKQKLMAPKTNSIYVQTYIKDQLMYRFLHPVFKDHKQIHIQLTRARSPSKAKALCRTSEASSVQQCKSRSLKEHCETCRIVIEITSRNHAISGLTMLKQIPIRQIESENSENAE